MKWSRTGLAVLLPLAVMAIWTVSHEWAARHGELVEFPVSGYDPRSLLSGHYLTYRVEYGLDSMCRSGFPQDHCLCLAVASSGREARANWEGSCEQKPVVCSLWIRGQCGYDGFAAGIERFYFPEKYSEALARVPPKATIRVRVSPTGVATVTDFLVDGKPIADFVKAAKN